MDQNSSNLFFFIGNTRTFLFKTQEIVENSTFQKNKFPELPEKVRNDKPGIEVVTSVMPQLSAFTKGFIHFTYLIL